MKKVISLFAVFAFSVQLFGWTPPSNVPTPSFPSTTRLRVVGANVLNYLDDFTASNRSCVDMEQFETKTNKMANVFVYLKADIVALCEIQQDDNILSYLVEAMNNIYGSDVYDYVWDGTTCKTGTGGYVSIKCGYVYRTDKVDYGNQYSTNPSNNTFKNRMRVVCFTEKKTNQRFVLSLNHFQAKNSDSSGKQRNEQADQLVKSLSSNNYGDPDILIVGDLNSETEETCVQKLISAGYDEQMVKYDEKAYSYTYYGKRELIDHALANSSMAQQITGAYAYHINTTSNTAYSYADHDCYVVGLSLGKTDIDAVSEWGDTPHRQLIYRNGQILVQMGESIYDMMGRKVE